MIVMIRFIHLTQNLVNRYKKQEENNIYFYKYIFCFTQNLKIILNYQHFLFLKFSGSFCDIIIIYVPINLQYYCYTSLVYDFIIILL